MLLVFLYRVSSTNRSHALKHVKDTEAQNCHFSITRCVRQNENQVSFGGVRDRSRGGETRKIYPSVSVISIAACKDRTIRASKFLALIGTLESMAYASYWPFCGISLRRGMRSINHRSPAPSRRSKLQFFDQQRSIDVPNKWKCLKKFAMPPQMNQRCCR